MRQVFGPEDSAELLRELSNITNLQPGQVVSRLTLLLKRFPLSHNLRYALFLALLESGESAEAWKLMAATVALYPDSNVLLRALLKHSEDGLDPESTTLLQDRAAKTEAHLGLH